MWLTGGMEIGIEDVWMRGVFAATVLGGLVLTSVLIGLITDMVGAWRLAHWFLCWMCLSVAAHSPASNATLRHSLRHMFSSDQKKKVSNRLMLLPPPLARGASGECLHG